MKVRKMMKTIGILVLLVGFLYGFFYLSIKFIRMWNDGDFIRFMPKVIAKEKLSKEYGGVYVFYPEFREEIKKRERERKEYMDRFFEKNDVFTKDDLAKLDSTLPQTLSNGCKYHNQAFGPYDPLFDSYYEKIKEFVGEEVYQKLKPSFRITSFYRCEDGSEGLITLWTDIGTTYKKFGLFGDEGAGFSLTETEEIGIGGSNTFELIDGKFVKVDKKYEGWR